MGASGVDALRRGGSRQPDAPRAADGDAAAPSPSERTLRAELNRRIWSATGFGRALPRLAPGCAIEPNDTGIFSPGAELAKAAESHDSEAARTRAVTHL